MLKLINNLYFITEMNYFLIALLLFSCYNKHKKFLDWNKCIWYSPSLYRSVWGVVLKIPMQALLIHKKRMCLIYDVLSRREVTPILLITLVQSLLLVYLFIEIRIIWCCLWRFTYIFDHICVLCRPNRIKGL